MFTFVKTYIMEIYFILLFAVGLAIAATQVIIIALFHANKQRMNNVPIHRKDVASRYEFPFHRLADERLTVSPRGMLIIALDYIRETGLNNEDAVEFISTFFSVYMKRNNLRIVNDDKTWLLLFEEKDFIKWDDSIKSED